MKQADNLATTKEPDVETAEVEEIPPQPDSTEFPDTEDTETDESADVKPTTDGTAVYPGNADATISSSNDADVTDVSSDKADVTTVSSGSIDSSSVSSDDADATTMAADSGDAMPADYAETTTILPDNSDITSVSTDNVEYNAPASTTDEVTEAVSSDDVEAMYENGVPPPGIPKPPLPAESSEHLHLFNDVEPATTTPSVPVEDGASVDEELVDSTTTPPQENNPSLDTETEYNKESESAGTSVWDDPTTTPHLEAGTETTGKGDTVNEFEPLPSADDDVTPETSARTQVFFLTIGCPY